MNLERLHKFEINRTRSLLADGGSQIPPTTGDTDHIAQRSDPKPDKNRQPVPRGISQEMERTQYFHV